MSDVGISIESITDSDSVATFSEKAQSVLSYDMEKLIGVAPELADYATVPEFGTIVSMILIVSIVSGIVISKRFNMKI